MAAALTPVLLFPTLSTAQKPSSAPASCAKTYTRAEFHQAARKAFKAYPYTAHELRTLRRVVRCQAGGARSRKIVRFHYHRYWRAFDHRFGRVQLGDFIATSYGPPWGGIEGTGITSTGVTLNGHAYSVAVAPNVIPYGSRLYIWPNPWGYRGTFVANDTGGAIRSENGGRRIDFYDSRGRAHQYGWGRRHVQVARRR